MRRVLAALACLFGPAHAQAEPILVRSGEHAGFSRLVIEFPERPAWSLRTSDGRVEIALAPGDRSFDLSQVFQRIPRSRIREVLPSDTGLALVLGCACRVTAFEARRSALAVDVADASPDTVLSDIAQTSATGDEGADLPPSPSDPAGGIVARTAAPDMAAPLPDPDRPESVAAGPLPLPASSRAPASLTAPAPETPPRSGEPPDRSMSTLDRLAEGVARAASQGVLRLAPRPEGDAAREASAATIGAAPDSNLRLRIPGEAEWSDEPERDARCLDGDAFDIAAWNPPGSDAAVLIAEARARLAESLDTVDEARAVDLARTYIALGFGAEARAVLTALAPRSADAGSLEALARIVDDDPLPIAGLDQQVGCPGRAQLWVALAAGRAGTPEDTLVAVAELPLALRRHIAARLIPLFLEADDPATAEAIRATVQRASGPHGAGFDLAAARIDAETGKPAGAATLRDLARSASPVSDEALELFLALGNEGGPAAESPDLARAETRADDLRGSEPGSRIEAELILAAIRAEAFDLAGSRLADALAAGHLPEERRDELVARYVSALSDTATDEVVLVNAAAFEDAFAARAARGEVGTRLARRLMDLGFPRLARAYAPTGDRADGALEAELLLMAGDAAAALEQLDAVAEPQETHLALRAAALLALDRPAEAAEVYDALGDSRGATAARRAVDMQSIASPTPLVGTGGGIAPQATLPDLVAASELTRTGIEALLRDLASP